MDGLFVPNLTFGIPIIKMIAKKCTLPLDAHLMVTNPRFHIEQMKDFGLHNITFHFEAVTDAIELVTYAKQFYPSVGVSIKPKTKVSELSDELLQQIDLLLVMSVEPGFGGQSFIENTYKKLEEINQVKQRLGLTFSIQIDGGVSDKNSKQLLQAGADNLVAGSYIFKDGPNSYHQKILSLRS
jgi:ribulose-phosphate 3-epimerase